MVKVLFGIFSRKVDVPDVPRTSQQIDEKEQSRTVLKRTDEVLEKIEMRTSDIQDQRIFTALMAFISYYHCLIGYYNRDLEKMMVVRDLLTLKYVDMVLEILTGFDEKTAAPERVKDVAVTLATINDKLFAIIKEIREVAEMNLNVDLRTLQDLVKSDF